MSNLSHTGVGNPDGYAFVVQNYRSAPPILCGQFPPLSFTFFFFLCQDNAFGAGAGGLGYGSTPDYYDLGIKSSVAIEFDTYKVISLFATLLIHSIKETRVH